MGKMFKDFINQIICGDVEKVLDWIIEVMELEPTGFSTTLEAKRKSLINDWGKTMGNWYKIH